MRARAAARKRRVPWFAGCLPALVLVGCAGGPPEVGEGGAGGPVGEGAAEPVTAAAGTSALSGAPRPAAGAGASGSSGADVAMPGDSERSAAMATEGAPRLEDAEAEDVFTEFPDTFHLRLGGGLVFNAETTLSLGPSPLQARIDWKDTLGGDGSSAFWRADAMYRFSPRHSLSLSGYGVMRSSEKILEEEIEIGDEVFPLGGKVSSDLDMYLARLFYGWSFYRSEEVELTLNGGFYFGYVGLKVRAEGVAGSAGGEVEGSEAILVPVPTVGLAMRYHILPRLTAFAGVDWFYLQFSGWEGSLLELKFGLEYRLFDHFGIGAAFNRLEIEVDGTFSNDGKVNVTNDWNIAHFYGILYF